MPPTPAGEICRDRALGPSTSPRVGCQPRRSSEFWPASAGSVEEETGDRGDHVLFAQRRGGGEHADDQADEGLRQAGARNVRPNLSTLLPTLEQQPERGCEQAFESL